MRCTPLVLALLLVPTLAAGAALAGLDERVNSAGDFAKGAVNHAATFDAQGAYDSATAYQGRETAYAYATYAFVGAFAEQQAWDTAGPVGGWAVGTFTAAGDVLTQTTGTNTDAARHGANSCFQGFLPGFWDGVRPICLAQRQVAETLLGKPLPEL